MKLKVPEYISSIEPYKPGKPLEELEREYGLDGSIKLASNENPLGPSPMAVEAVREHLNRLHRYPDGSGFELTRLLAKKLGVSPDQILIGNGSDEVIGMLARAFLVPGDEVVIPRPSFLMYEIMVKSVGAKPIFVPLNAALTIDLNSMLDHVTSATRMIFLCNPNNPTGTIVRVREFEAFLAALPGDVTVVLDEAYIEFVRDHQCARGVSYVDGQPPVVTLRTFSKVYGLAGLRIGYGVMPAVMAGYLNRIRQPFNTGSLAQVGAAAALEDHGFLEKTLRLVHDELDYLFRSLDELNIRRFPTQSNFFLIDVETNADRIYEKMLRQGVIVRSMNSYGYPNFIRINIGLPQENRRFVRTLAQILGKSEQTDDISESTIE